MATRPAVGVARRTHDACAEQKARGDVDRAKCALGERGAVWWKDGALYLDRHLARNTPYAAWFAALEPASSA